MHSTSERCSASTALIRLQLWWTRPLLWFMLSPPPRDPPEGRSDFRLCSNYRIHELRSIVAQGLRSSIGSVDHGSIEKIPTERTHGTTPNARNFITPSASFTTTAPVCWENPLSQLRRHPLSRSKPRVAVPAGPGDISHEVSGCSERVLLCRQYRRQILSFVR